jgi:phosphatidylinositol alpha-mannosyltransferase
MQSNNTMVDERQSLKVGFVLDGGLAKPDGVQQYILGLGNWLKSQGHQVRYLVAGSIAPGIDDAVSLSRNVAVIGNGNRLTIPLPAKRSVLKAYLDKEQFDVVHVQTPYSPMMGEKLVKLCGKQTAVIGTFHIVPLNRLLAIGDYLLGHYCYFSLKRFDKMLSVSSAAKVVARRDYKIDSEILPNVIDYNRFRYATPFSRYQDGKLNILFFGRLVPRKGCDILLMAINKLKATQPDLPDYRVIVCGAGPMKAKLEQYVSAHGLEQIVEFNGFIEEIDKPSYYASADLSVFPSIGGESFGIVLLEALASGKACVLAGDNMGYRSVMEPRQELLFDPKNIDELVIKIQKYLVDITARKQASDWGSVYASEFDVNIVGGKLLNIYRKVLRKRSQQWIM